MQSKLSLLMFGSFDASWAGASLRFATNTARALLAYLAIEAERPLARAQLAELFWPEQAGTTAFNNLRQTLLRVRKAFPDLAHADAALTVTKGAIQFNREAATSDVARFEDLLAECTLHTHANLATCPECIGRMQAAVALYRGEFLSGLTVDDCQPFEEWLLFKREQFHRQTLEALNVLTLHYESCGQYEPMRQCAAQQLALEAWREEAHAQLMRALAYMGDRSAALAQFDTCRKLLQTEFGIDPNRELRELAERIRLGTLDKPAVVPVRRPLQPIAPSDWQQIPDAGELFGREKELAQIDEWLVRDHSRLIWVFGIGGVGKTSLASSAAAAAAPHFDVVIWQTLLNAPPVDEVLRAAVQTLSKHGVGAFPAGLDAQLALLMDLMRQTRCLLVLDNFESILQAGETGTYLLGYEAYDQLIQRMAQSRHDGCLLITSREQPRETARLNGSAGVHALRLTGLAPEAGRAMLAEYHLGNETADANTLVRRYSGNPLAIKLVAQTVQELFMGSIGDFLSAEAPIFDDVRTVLDQQFERLSALQREMLFWLAVTREATTIATLRESLLQPLPPREFLEALRALQRRSLLEQVSAGDALPSQVQAQAALLGGAAFTLQNVIMEYVTDQLIDAMCSDVETSQLETLNRYALMQSQAKEYVLQSQIRLILKPVAERLVASLGKAGLAHRLQCLLAQLRAWPPRSPGYAAGNILNLLLHLGFNTADYDFAGLDVRQADLREARFIPLHFRDADLADSTFIQSMDVAAVKFIDSTRLLVAGIEGSEICLWRIADGQLQNAFHHRSYGGYPIIFSEDGRLMANSGPDFVVRVRSAETGALLQTLVGLTKQPFIPAFSRDGALLACGGRDNTVRVWDVSTGEMLHTISVADNQDLITGLAFSPDGAWLVGGGSRHDVWVWDLRQRGAFVNKLHGHVRELEYFAFSPDASLLASGSHDGSIGIWDMTTGGCMHMLQGHKQVVRVLAFDPQGRMLASGSADQTVRLWDARRAETLHTLTGHMGEVTALSFNPDGSVLATGGQDRSVRRWDVRSGQTLEIVSSHTTMVNSVQWSPVAPVLAGGGGDGVLRLWNADAAARDSAMRYVENRQTVPIQSIAYEPGGRWLVSGDADHAVRVWDVDAGKLLGVLQGHADKVKSVAVAADGTRIASGSSDWTIRLWPVDPARGKVLDAAAAAKVEAKTEVLRLHKDAIVSVEFSRDGRFLLSASLDHTARVWDLAEQHEIGVLHGHASALCGATFSPDGRFILTNSWDYTVAAWDAQTMQRLDLPGIDAMRGRGVVFSTDGRWIASVTHDHAIELRQWRTGALCATLRGHDMTVRTLSFNADGTLLASGSWDGEIRLWDTRTGQCVQVWRPPGPYAAMDITGVSGISPAQKVALQMLGAISNDADKHV